VLDYPLTAWERDSGDGKDGPRTQRIETFLKGEKKNGKRSGDGRIKQEMREVIESRFQKLPSLFPDEHTTTDQVVAEARTEYERLHELPIFDPDEREEYYREHVEKSPPLQALKRAMDEWCAVWFWPTDEESLKHVPTPLNFHKALEERATIIDRLASDLKFFHWELAFPDVFTPQREGFDAVLGNPPWEVMKANSHEFFSDHDPIYRTFDKKAAVDRQQVLFGSMPGVKDRWDEYNASFKALSNHVKSAAAPFDLALLRGKQNETLAAAWSKARAKRVGYARGEMPFAHQGSADLNSYKLFLEVAHHLLTSQGRLGFIVPSGLYTDSGTQALRHLFLDRSTWEWLFGFENRKKIFDIDGRFKFAPTIVDCRRTNSPLHAAFMVHDLEAWERSDPPVFDYDRALIPLFSPKSKSLPEVRTQRDLAICRTIYEHSIRIGDNAPGWEITYAREFDMTNDAKAGRFSPLEKWKTKGYKPDVFARWIGPQGEVALPLYEGRMIGQFDFSQKGWVSGKGRTAIWRPIPFDAKSVEPQFLMEAPTFLAAEGVHPGAKVGFMDVTSATNSRTFIACALIAAPCGNKVPTLTVRAGGLCKHLMLSAICNSLAFDFCTRTRLGGITLNWFIVEELPLPSTIPLSHADRLALAAGALTLVHRRFAPDWLILKRKFPLLSQKEWKQWWAVTEADRLRLRVEIEAVCADVYGVQPDDLDWIVRHEPNDPKGFWRVDKALPFRERLTGLAAAAFRALKAGKWSVESAGGLSNHEFFEAHRRP
jgi:hypothetical protein